MKKKKKPKPRIGALDCQGIPLDSCKGKISVPTSIYTPEPEMKALGDLGRW